MKSERKFAAKVLKKHGRNDLLNLSMKVDLDNPKHVIISGDSIANIRTDMITNNQIGPFDMIQTDAVHIYIKTPFGNYEVTVRRI